LSSNCSDDNVALSSHFLWLALSQRALRHVEDWSWILHTVVTVVALGMAAGAIPFYQGGCFDIIPSHSVVSMNSSTPFATSSSWLPLVLFFIAPASICILLATANITLLCSSDRANESNLHDFVASKSTGHSSPLFIDCQSSVAIGVVFGRFLGIFRTSFHYMFRDCETAEIFGFIVIQHFLSRAKDFGMHYYTSVGDRRHGLVHDRRAMV
jgi:hypothetical protein